MFIDRIFRDTENRQGPKRDPIKLSQIYVAISRSPKPLSLKEIQSSLPHIKEDDLKKQLAYLIKFPCITSARQEKVNHMAGAPPLQYVIDDRCLQACKHQKSMENLEEMQMAFESMIPK